VPAKALDEAKGRLAALLREDERRSLALVMLEDVLRALQGARRVERIYVISPDQAILRDAERLGAEAIAQPPSLSGLNEALKHGLRVISLEDPSALLVVLADVPAISSSDIDSLVDALPGDAGVVIAPSRADGTSALALRPADVIDFRFGQESRAAHQREATARGVPVQVMSIEPLLHDVDEPEDLRYLISHAAETATHRLLAELRVAERLEA
jgi:2-phospho-L-lactate guanylyltransferase